MHTAETAATGPMPPAGPARAAVGADSPPVDLVHLSRQTFGSRDLEREVLALFLAQSTALVEHIRSAGDPGQRFRAAHTIKGSARGIGAWRVARLAEAVELADRMPADATRLVAELEAAVDEANRFIRTVAAA